jgi:hypothetical protein
LWRQTPFLGGFTERRLKSRLAAIIGGPTLG